jgi:hypothetical protein
LAARQELGKSSLLALMVDTVLQHNAFLWHAEGLTQARLPRSERRGVAVGCRYFELIHELDRPMPLWQTMGRSVRPVTIVNSSLHWPPGIGMASTPGRSDRRSSSDE